MSGSAKRRRGVTESLGVPTLDWGAATPACPSLVIWMEDRMKPHITDRPRSQTPQRMRRYLEIERSAGQHPAVHALGKRPKPSDGPRRTPQFLRIARGITF